MSESVASRLFNELAEHGDVYLSAPPTAWLDSLPRRVKAGDLPAGVFEVDGRAALRQVNLARLQQLFIRYRRSVGGHALRGFLPTAVPAAGEPRAFGPTPGSPWVRAVDAPETAAAHARQALSSHLTVAANLHGSALVALGICSWEQIKGDGVRQWEQLCDTLAAHEAPVSEAAKEEAA